MRIEDFTRFSSKYNVDNITLFNFLQEIIKENFNIGDVFMKDTFFYERYVNKNGIIKERKLRFTKKNINNIINELRKKLLVYYHNNLKQQILKKFLLNVVKGTVVAKNNQFYIINIEQCKIVGLLNVKNCKNKWELGEKGFFHIKKVTSNDKEVIVFLDDYSINIDKYKIYKICNGIHIRNIKILRDKIIIKSTPKINKDISKKIKSLFNKKIYIKG